MSDPLYLADEAATEACGLALAAAWSAAATPSCLVTLEGDLGAGKTTLTRGLLRGLGESGAVRSPTYTLIESYALLGGGTVHHLDCYRIEGWDALEELGFRDLAGGGVLVIVEWAIKVLGLSARADLTLTLKVAGEGRRLVAEGRTALGRTLAEGFRKIPR